MTGAPVLLDASGRPIARPATSAKVECPRCGKPPARRVLSAGFGEPHDVCGHCGYDFEERTL